MSVPSVIRLKPVVQRYDWGKLASESLVAKFTGQTKGEEPFAELWFGAHKKASSRIDYQGREQSLSSVIEAEPELFLGSKLQARFGARLPFLFKILSVGRPLSIQVHPDTELATKLHARDPLNYPDPYHKPEIGVAYSEVDFLCGFRPSNNLYRSLSGVPELLDCLPKETIAALNTVSDSRYHSLLEEIYRRIMTLSEREVKRSCAKLVARVSLNPSSPEDKWLLRAAKIYPEGDVGFFSFFLLNLVTIKPGEAIFSKPGVPHAYLSGDIIECMANSDNTIRAGLTSKHRDTETLLEMVDYTYTDVCRVQTKTTDSNILYPVEAEEFSLQEYSTDAWTEIEKPAILFCLEGQAEIVAGEDRETLLPGEAVFSPAAAPGQSHVRAEGRVFITTAG